VLLFLQVLEQIGTGENAFDSEDVIASQKTGLIIPAVRVTKMSFTSKDGTTIDGVRFRFNCTDELANEVLGKFDWPGVEDEEDLETIKSQV
jgi:hypothetical protein